MPEGQIPQTNEGLSLVDKVTVLGGLAAVGVVYNVFQPEIRQAEQWTADTVHAAWQRIGSVIKGFVGNND